MYDYMLGGTHNFQVDREATEQFRAQMPDLADAAWANRGFHGRAARWLATERGIRQFIDIGSGLPTQNNTHQVVRAVSPDARAWSASHRRTWQSRRTQRRCRRRLAIGIRGCWTGFGHAHEGPKPTNLPE
jgi:hypothetical protein